jgi:hypothetical protein
MHTDTATLLPALIKAHKEITDYRHELAGIHSSELPKDYDAVVISEWLAELAHSVASDNACLRNRNGSGYVRQGIDSVAGYLASFWETHHLLAEVLGEYELGLRKFFEHAEEMLRREIDNNSPTPPRKPTLTDKQKDDLAEKAANAFWLVLMDAVDAKNEHDLGGWASVSQGENSEHLERIAKEAVNDFLQVVENANG